LYQFCLHARRYGSWEVWASSPDVTLAGLKLRRGARFTYEYDLNIPWRHEVRIEENRLAAEPGKVLPRCIGAVRLSDTVYCHKKFLPAESARACLQTPAIARAGLYRA